MLQKNRQDDFVYLGLGSNLGPTVEQLSQAVDAIRHLDVWDMVCSGEYVTEPWGEPNQAAFLNMAVGFNTSLDPMELLGALQSIEKRMRKHKTSRWGARNIDIDILLFGNRILHEKELVIPHPYLHLRNFVLVPLAEIAPDLIHPVFGKSIRELRDECQDEKKVWMPEPIADTLPKS